MEKKIRVLNREIRILLHDTGAGLNVLIEGGDQGHIGAVAALSPQQPLQIITFPGHKEEVLCRQWARELCRVYHGTVAVEAGVHYDNIGKEEIKEIMDALKQELDKIVQQIEEENGHMADR